MAADATPIPFECQDENRTSCLSSIILSPLNGNVKMSPMSLETFALSQKELQRVAVISRCLKGEMAHANPGRPSDRLTFSACD